MQKINTTEIYDVSQTKLIREMDAEDLESEYIRLIAGISGSLCIITDYDRLNVIRDQYRQITGENISNNLFKTKK